MKPSSTCSVCGKLISKGYICEDCEKEILERGKGKRYALTILTTLLLIFVLFFMWSYYRTSEAEFAQVKSNGVFLDVIATMRTRTPLAVLVLFGVAMLVTVFYYFSTTSARRKR